MICCKYTRDGALRLACDCMDTLGQTACIYREEEEEEEDDGGEAPLEEE